MKFTTVCGECGEEAILPVTTTGLILCEECKADKTRLILRDEGAVFGYIVEDEGKVFFSDSTGLFKLPLTKSLLFDDLDNILSALSTDMDSYWVELDGKLYYGEVTKEWGGKRKSFELKVINTSTR